MMRSATKKNSDVTMTMMKTITEVIQVSLRVVQVILRASARTSRKNWAGDTRLRGGSAVTVPAPPGVAGTGGRVVRDLLDVGRLPVGLAMAATVLLM